MSKYIADTRLRDILEQLASVGSPVDLTVCEAGQENAKLEILQQGWVGGSQVLELESGRAAFMAELAITSQSSRTIDIVDVELQWPWGQGSFQWLSPVSVPLPRQARRRQEWHTAYWLGRLEFPCDEVINEALIKRRKLSARSRIEGMLLGVGGSIPMGIRNRQLLSMRLAIYTADHAECSADLKVLLQRSERRANIGRKRSRIFEDVDLSAAIEGDEPEPSPEPTPRQEAEVIVEIGLHP